MEDINLHCYEKIIKEISSNYEEYLEGEEKFIKSIIEKIYIKNINVIVEEVYKNLLPDINETINDYEYNFT